LHLVISDRRSEPITNLGGGS